jgi:DNA-binding Xre family transcriptional regulator
MVAAEQIVLDEEGEVKSECGETDGLLSDSVAKRKHYKKKEALDEHYNTDLYDSVFFDSIFQGIGQNICIVMNQKGYNLTRLAAHSNIDSATLSRFLNGKARISLIALIKVSIVLDVCPGDLFPIDLNNRRTSGQIFDDITKNLNVKEVNYLLEVAAGLSNLK